MTSSATIEALAVPQQYSPDPELQAFCECSIWNFTEQKSARDLLAAARKRFGDYRCIGLEFWEH